MPRTARLEPLPPTPMGRPPGRTPATRGRSRSHRGGTAEVEDRRLTHGLTSGDLFRVGQTPRALRLTQSNVGKLTDERLPWRDTRPLSAGRLGPAAVRAEGTGSGGQGWLKDHGRAESCPRAADHVKRNGAVGTGADKDVHMRAETCKTCTIIATLMHTTRLGSSEVYDDLCNLCANSVASVHRDRKSV